MLIERSQRNWWNRKEYPFSFFDLPHSRGDGIPIDIVIALGVQCPDAKRANRRNSPLVLRILRDCSIQVFARDDCVIRQGTRTGRASSFTKVTLLFAEIGEIWMLHLSPTGRRSLRYPTRGLCTQRIAMIIKEAAGERKYISSFIYVYIRWYI